MKYLELKTKIKEQISPIYTIIGDDDYLIFNAIKTIKKYTLTEAPELNFVSFDEDTFNSNLIIDSAQQLPFISFKRCTVVFLPEKISKEDLEKLEKYSSSPNPDSVLIFVDKAKCLKFGEQIDCGKLSNPELLKLVPNFFNKYNKSITLDTANLLIERCDNDAMRIAKEAEKLSYYCEEQIVKKEDVEKLVKTDLQFEVFKLINFIAGKNKNEAIKQINTLIDTKEDPIGVITLLSATFRRMFYAKITDISNQELAEKLNVKPFAISKAKEYCSKFSQKQLKKILELCEELDYTVKQSQISPANALYFLVFSIFAY